MAFNDNVSTGSMIYALFSRETLSGINVESGFGNSSRNVFNVEKFNDLPTNAPTSSMGRVLSNQGKHYIKYDSGWKSTCSWELIGRVTLSSPAESMTANLLPRKYLMMWCRIFGKSVASKSRIRFNGDISNNYAFRLIDDVSSLTALNQSGIDLSRETTAGGEFWHGYLFNVPEQAKRFIHHGPFNTDSPDTAPKHESSRGNYSITSGQITSITIDSGSPLVTLNANSELIVWGRDDD